LKTGEKVAYWLIPAEPAFQFFHRQIVELGGRYGEAAFEPHLTLYGDDCLAGEAGEMVPQIVAQLAHLPEASDLQLDFIRYDHSEKFTKTLYASYSRTEPLLRLMDWLKRRTGDRRSYDLQPHVSLLYSHLREKERHQLAAKLPAPPKTLRFAAAAAIRYSGEINSSAEVRRWELLGRCAIAPHFSTEV
jgi:hypothetical protein